MTGKKQYNAICIKPFKSKDCHPFQRKTDILEIIKFERYQVNCIRAMLRTTYGDLMEYWFVDDIKDPVATHGGCVIARKSFWKYFKELQ